VYWILYECAHRIADDFGCGDVRRDCADAIIPAGASIPAYGFYLIADGGFSGEKDNSSWQDADFVDAMNFNNNNGGVCLENSSGAVVDTVGGGSSAAVYEGAPTSDPSKGKSIERKANETGAIPGYGNAWDTDNNSDDFVLREVPDPQNSDSGPLPLLPELSTLILISIGVIMLVCIVSFKRSKSE